MPVVILVALVVIGFSVWQSKKRREQWQEFARSKGLQYSEPSFFTKPEIAGVLEGVEVHIGIEMRGGKNKSPYTRFSAKIPGPLPSSVFIGAEGLFQKIGKAFGAQDIELGDAFLDSKLMIKGHKPASVKRYLEDRRVARAAVELVTTRGEGSVRDGAVVIVERGWLVDHALEAQLEYAVQSAIDLSPDEVPPRSQKLPEPHAPELPPTPPIPEPRVLTPDPEPPPAAPPPEPEPDVMADLARLSDPFVLSSEADEIIARWMGTELSLDLEFRRIDRPFSFGAADENPEGPTLIGDAAGLEVHVKLPPDADDGTDSMRSGETVSVRGTVSEYDNLFRRLVLLGNAE